MQGSARIDELRQKFHENPRRYFAPLANEYRKAGDPEQAIAICRAHLAQQPGHMSGHVVYAQSLYDAGRIDESRVVFEKALSLDPDNAIVLKQLGDISRQRGDTGEARHWYSRAFEADPHDRETAAYIAELTEPLTEGEGTAASASATEAVPQADAETAAHSEQVADVEPLSGAEPVANAESAAEIEPVVEAERPVVEAEQPVVEAEQPVAEAEQPVPAESVADAGPSTDVGSVAEEEAAADVEAPVPTWSLADEPVGDEHDAAAEADVRPLAEMEPFADLEAPAGGASLEPDSGTTAHEAELARQEADVEVPKAEPSQEPEVAGVSSEHFESEPQSDEPDVSPVPLTTSSPFVTRTMADLYARQGYKDQALQVYRELAQANPDDPEIADRIRELTAAAEPEVAPVELTDETTHESATQQVDLADAPSAESEPAMTSSPADDFSEPADSDAELGFKSSEEMMAEEAAAAEVEEPVAPRHFTEMELAPGDEWDTSQWASGFSADDEEVEPLDFSASNATPEDNESDALAMAPGLEDAPPVESAGATDEHSESYERAAEAVDSQESVTARYDVGSSADDAEVTSDAATSDERPAPEESTAPEVAWFPEEAEGSEAPVPEVAPVPDESQTEEVWAPAAVSAPDDSPASDAPVVPATEFTPSGEPTDPDHWREPEPVEDAAPVYESSPEPDSEAAASILPLGVLNDARDDVSSEEMFAAANLVTSTGEHAESAEDAVVAYSPQTPDEKDLAHYTPTGPTVREFFATLGAYKPDHNAPASFTARAAVPEIQRTETESDQAADEWRPGESADPVPEPDVYPLASDAFANLFPDSPISDEDSKAAFALSGALTAQPPSTAPRSTPPRPTTPAAPPPAAPPTPTGATQESEEDIRRFREWLDGLADS